MIRTSSRTLILQIVYSPDGNWPGEGSNWGRGELGVNLGYVVITVIEVHLRSLNLPIHIHVFSSYLNAFSVPGTWGARVNETAREPTFCVLLEEASK